MTVSVVLNGARSATRVSDATRARIVEAAARLRYRPNAAARGLQRRRMDALGVAATIDGGELNLYFLEVLNGILEAASARGQNTTVFPVGPEWDAGAGERLLEFCDGRVDGLILLAPVLSREIAEALRDCIPYVSIHDNDPLPGTWSLEVDNEGGAYAAARHLIELGHRDILHLAGPLALTGARQRRDGWRRALAEAGLDAGEANVVECGYSRFGGETAMAALLAQGRLPGAVFCANDAVAIGCLEAMAAQGLRAPDHVSVVGFDDSLAARMTVPPLTTVRQPLRELGHRATELLLSQIPGAVSDGNAPPAAEPRTEVLGVSLAVRGSAGLPAPRNFVFRRGNAPKVHPQPEVKDTHHETASSR